jgi:hypothetical protein
VVVAVVVAVVVSVVVGVVDPHKLMDGGHTPCEMKEPQYPLADLHGPKVLGLQSSQAG